ncbi:toxin-antitoxin system YwqK family antitoxin [Saprospira grandis]|uniref:toxin-antitoxin system YwqK family antitoxin n=1 Tax=Saprospira grandis TaxID=1008 RepID=UPI0022DD0A5B|nr:hypothetical protein [Saprospira grandis]WBM76195.1 hypothetical protein OP864_08165 [Saprospira grandis]
MRAFYILLPILAISLASSSCIFSDLFGAGKQEFVADTVVAVPSIKDIRVQFLLTDTTNDVVRYWSDRSGRPIYQRSEESFIGQKRDGFQREWNEDGILILEAQWNKGLPIEYRIERYDDGSLKRKVLYNSQKGYARYEVNFHPNGRLKTDTILYNEGVKEGKINYYDTAGVLVEQHIFADNELVGIEIFRAEFENVFNKVAYLERSLVQDSIDAIRQDSVFRAVLGDVDPAAAKAGAGIAWKNDYNELENLRYLEGLMNPEKRLADSARADSLRNINSIDEK